MILSSNRIPRAKIMVVGLPRSGTTLVSSSIHSCTNAVCLAEPHHEMEGSGTLSLDKISTWTGIYPYNPNHPLPMNDFFEELGQFYPYVGFKETYRDARAFGYPGNVDLIERYRQSGYRVIPVVRNPIACWNSTKQTDVTTNIENFILNWLEFFKFIFPLRPIVYEKFCENPVLEMKSKTGFSLDGKFELIPSHFSLGDFTAKTQTGIFHRKLDNKVLVEEELQMRGLLNFYRSTL